MAQPASDEFEADYINLHVNVRSMYSEDDNFITLDLDTDHKDWLYLFTVMVLRVPCPSFTRLYIVLKL